ncbi:50S ribosomal protein L25/general stress protein Ctc [Microbispora bryophytorum]|uniref:Large ribosomal subunit protein bL25 n=1 Tax=Microbispora bryophytorum TaxID=1460882 RepID=A0A8H9LBB1_9ACTN|nr:50S ribosomal protein L25/general stress protein Ctc [Microbispora bryophytorum]MBD3136539.1 50S ribosomal protein L25/general stress protein Ctc [Microbispora bryophytorum]TQS06144.1 50S ribosomal protein L25/general stress protein Ctc [Microbispora bryophytorum]GGO18412.1 50S ribosomal protein L25 [Microbispora bryophytorum]
MSEVRIAAELRNEFGKGAARKIRRGNKVPAVLYGHGTETKHLTLPGHELLLALRTPNVLIRLEGEGVDEIALPKGVQRDPIKGFLEHVDLLLVKRGEKVTVEIPVTVTGDTIGSAIVEQQLVTISVETEATHIPTGVEVDVDGKDAGFVVHASDLNLPSGTTLAGDPEALVLQVIGAPTAELPEGAEGAEGDSAAE